MPVIPVFKATELWHIAMFAISGEVYLRLLMRESPAGMKIEQINTKEICNRKKPPAGLGRRQCPMLAGAQLHCAVTVRKAAA